MTAIVEDESGARFGVQATFFRQGLDPEVPEVGQSALRARQVLAAHLAVAARSTGGVSDTLSVCGGSPPALPDSRKPTSPCGSTTGAWSEMLSGSFTQWLPTAPQASPLISRCDRRDLC